MSSRPPFYPRLAMAFLASASWLLTGIASAGEALNAEQMKKWTERFEKEVWPLLSRNGKDGCVGCHTPRHRSTLRMSGHAGEEFERLLTGGFLLPEDPGAFLHVVSTPNPKTHMPPGKRAAWTADEIALLKRFVIELDSALNQS